MKFSRLLLLGSLVANAALVGALLLTAPGAGTAPLAQSAAPTAPDPTTHSTAAATNHPPTGVAPASPAPAAVTLWSTLQTDDFGELARRLRAAGFPPKEVRALLAAAIVARNTARREALLGITSDTPYWRSQGSATISPANQAKYREIFHEQGALLYQFVNGPDALAEDEEVLMNAQRRFGRLPLEKLQQLTAMDHDLNEKQTKFYDWTSGHAPTAEEQKAAMIANTNLQKEYRAAVAQLLTPAELEQYQLRHDAAGLVMGLQTFRPTEAEFKALYALQREVRSRYETATDPGQIQAMAEATRVQSEEKLKSALGPERYAEYQAVQNAGSDKLGKLIARLELPLTTITTVNAVRDDINARAQTVANDAALSTADRNAALAALAQEAQQKLTASLGGDRGYRAYAEIKGEWIRALKPKGK